MPSRKSTFSMAHRRSDSPFVDTVWQTESQVAGSFTSAAGLNGELVVMRHHGRTLVTLRGPETKTSIAEFPADAEWFGISFRLGVFFPDFPPAVLRDRHEIDLPNGLGDSFHIKGESLDVPDFENADGFVSHLIREGLLVHDPLVDDVLEGRPIDLSQRAVQQRFARATGISHRTMRQIQRARHAVQLLEDGNSILDTVVLAGYYDQPHLTRSLKHFCGQTPLEISLESALRSEMLTRAAQSS